jgi:tRNA nucleotidyltransferase (CCA-adding enzyme)
MPERLNPPATVRKIASTLEDAGFETWCVGGAVRDAILGHQHLDWDLATAATPAQVRHIFRRTVPVGVQFGTVGVLDEDGIMHEVTTFRRDVKTDGRHAEVEFGASLDEDLARRDFTINAIAYSPSRNEIRDPFDGQKDLIDGVVRAVGGAHDRMREDRLRALRGMRFASRFDFRIDPETWDSIVESAPEMGRLSAERVKQEIEKTMDQVRFPSRAFVLWQKSGAFRTLIPQLADASSADMVVLDHLRMAAPALKRRSQRRILRIAGLFSLAPEHAERTLRDLRFANAEVAWIGAVLLRWRELMPGMERALLSDASVSDPQIRKWVSVSGRTRFAQIYRLADAYWWAKRERGEPAPEKSRIESVYRRALRIAFNDPVEVSDLAVDGTDLAKLGIRGPEVGRTLRRLLEIVIADPSKNVEDVLLDAARTSQTG